MRDLLKLLIVGAIILFSSQVYAEEYKVLVLPDNIVTENLDVDSYIYDPTEFFADGIITILDETDFIATKPVSDTREILKKEASLYIPTKNMTNKFKTTYNIEYPTVRKLAQKFGTRYVLLLTSTVDAQNYILRRTWWDFFNIPGASVIDPAYKINTYAVLVDTKNNLSVWSDTYYKTISVCENRIITRGPSPQTEQLAKIKDYSRYICPQIAENVQKAVLPSSVYSKESKQIYYDMGNIDNVFTKKYRHLGHEYNKVFNKDKETIGSAIDNSKERRERNKQKRAIKKAQKQAAKQAAKEAELNVKAEPVKEEVVKPAEVKLNSTLNKQSEPMPTSSYINNINERVQTTDGVIIKDSAANIKPVNNSMNYEEFSDTELNFRKKRHNLFGDKYVDRPVLRDYSK